MHQSRRRFSICKSSSEDAGSDAPLPHGGDQRQQEVLAKIAMLQTQKVRITNFLDERSAYLTKFTKDADTEFDMIGQNAMKELDQIGDQIMERLDSKMQSYEETAEMQRQEIEMNERVLEDFEDWIEEEKNEGMFFKSLGKVKKPQNNEEIKVKAKIEAQKVREIAEESAGSKTRMNIYLALMAILGLTIANAVFATPEVEWRKVAALGLIFIGLVAQVTYEQDISPPGAWARANAQSCNFQMLPLQQLGRVDRRLLLWVNFSIAWLLKPSMRRTYQHQKLGLMATPITIVNAVLQHMR